MLSSKTPYARRRRTAGRMSHPCPERDRRNPWIPLEPRCPIGRRDARSGDRKAALVDAPVRVGEWSAIFMSGIAPAEGSGRERLIMVKVGIACDPDDQQHAQAAIHHPVL